MKIHNVIKSRHNFIELVSRSFEDNRTFSNFELMNVLKDYLLN